MTVRVIEAEGASEFLPRVTFTTSSDAKETYFALARAASDASVAALDAAKDGAVTAEAADKMIDRARALNNLTSDVFAEWQRLETAQG